MATSPSSGPRTIQASEAKTHFLRILDEVERGEVVVVTRHGKNVARIVPVTSPLEHDENRQEKVRATISRIEELRRRVGTLSMEEILSARDEGRM
jgi:prevent-host-death family protein